MEVKDKTEGGKDSLSRHDENKPSDVSTGHTAQDKLQPGSDGYPAQEKSPDKTQNSFCRDAQELSEKGSAGLDEPAASGRQDSVQNPGIRQAEPDMQNKELHRTKTEPDEKLKAEVDGRKQMEEVFREREEQYKSLFNNIPTGVYRTTPDGHILMANRALIKMLGYSSFEELAPMNLEDRGNFHPDYPRSRFKELIERQGEVTGLESLWEKRDGSFIFVRESARAIRGEDGQILYYEGTVEDVTEQKRTEKELRENIAQLSKKNRYEKITRTVIESVHQSINLEDVMENAVEVLDKNVENVNVVSIYMVEGTEAVLKAYRGYPDWYIKRAGRIPYPKGVTWETIVNARSRYYADFDQDTSLGPAGREMGMKSCLSVPIRFGNEAIGTLNIVSFKKNAFDEEELKLLETVGQQIEAAIRNAKQAEELRKVKEELELRVTERTKELLEVNEKLKKEILWHKWAESTIQTSEEKFRALYDENPSMYFTVNEERRVLLVNHLGAEQLGYQVYDLVGQSVLNIFHEDDKREALEQLTKCFKNPGRVFNWELRKVRKDGGTVWVRESARAVRSQDGGMISLIVCEDITDRIRIEEELKGILEQLSKKNRYETIISTVTRAVHQSLNLQEVLENAVDAISKNMDLAEDVCIYMVEGEDAVLKAYRNLPDWYIERAGEIPYPRGFTWKTIIDGKPVYCPDVERDTIIGPAGRKLGTKSYLSMPIHYEGRTVGALIVHSSEENAFDEEELKLFEIVARQIEIAINNAKYVQASRESEERLKLALACADMGTWRWELTTDTDYRGANMNRIMGLEPVESSEPGDKFMGLIHPDDRTEAKKVFERIRQEGGDYLAEFRIIRPDGTTIWLRNQGKTIYGENGKPLYVTGASIDITNRKRVEEEILRRIQQQAVVAKVGQLALAGTDINTLMNEATALVAQTLEVEYCKVLELLPNGEELLLRAGVGWKEGYVGHATVGSGTDSQAGYTLISNEPVLVEDLRRETRFSGPPLLHEHGVISGMSVIIPGKERPYGVIGTHTSKPHNFTQEDAHFIQAIANILAEAIERKHMEEALRESQRVLTTLITNLPGMAYRIRNDQNWTVEFASGGCTDLTGYPPEDFISGKLTWIQIMHTDDIKRILDEVQDAINEEKNYELTYRIRTAEGKEKWVWEKGTGVLGPDGSLLAMEGFVTDITERKMAEEQVRASLREKEVLLKEIHHRVKNNLQIISSLLNLQSRTVKGKKALEKFKESQNRVKSMALIHEKLYQSKDLDRVNFAEYIRSLLSYLFNSYGAGSSVKLKIEVDDIFMNIDRAIPCGLIINEIVSNSLKYAFSEANWGEIRVHCKEDGGIYTLIIKNDGVPFPEKLDFRKTKSLGLQLVCALVEQLRGSIELDRADGTEFRITFS